MKNASLDRLATGRSSEGSHRTSRRVRLAAVLLAAAVLPLVATTSRPGEADAQTSNVKHIFDADPNGLIANRRPANVTFLGVSDGVARFEDSRAATAGYDKGFLAQPLDDSTQQVIPLARWGPAASVEVVDTAVGFLRGDSPDLLVLRGSSGRWTPRDPSVPTTLTWYGQQSGGFRDAQQIPLNLAPDEAPVGVEIVPSTARTSLVLATTSKLYVYTLRSGVFVLELVKDYGNRRVLALHHRPLSELSATEQWAGSTQLQNAFAVALATADGKLEIELLEAELPFIFGTKQLVSATDFKITGDVATPAVGGGDLRYGYLDSGKQELRIDLNLTERDPATGVVSTQQYTGRTLHRCDVFWCPPKTVTIAAADSSCASPATGFDVAYFTHHTIDLNPISTSADSMEAHALCTSPSGATVRVGGYQTQWFLSRPIPETTVPVGNGGVAVQPQVEVTFPCLEQLRFQLRIDNPRQDGDMSPARLVDTLAADSLFMANNENWSSTYTCSARVGETAGNVQATVMVPSAPPGAAALGPRAAATEAEMVTIALEVPPTRYNFSTGQWSWDQAVWRDFPGTTGMPALAADETDPALSPGMFLTAMPSVDVVERVELVGESAGCRTGAAIGETCVPEFEDGAPVPVAVLAAPPFVRGTGQTSTDPEFAEGSSATAEGSRFASTSVGTELELSLTIGDPLLKTVEIEFTAGVAYSGEQESSTAESRTVSKSTGYGGSAEADTVVVNVAKYLRYQGVVRNSSIGFGVCPAATPIESCPAEADADPELALTVASS